MTEESTTPPKVESVPSVPRSGPVSLSLVPAQPRPGGSIAAQNMVEVIPMIPRRVRAACAAGSVSRHPQAPVVTVSYRNSTGATDPRVTTSSGW